MKQLDFWERQFPGIPFALPIVLQVGEHRTDFGCRVCIADKGLDWKKVQRHPKDAATFVEHMTWHRISEQKEPARS